ncbi:unnamed protein product [Soboliphyme baturini]|uniref:PsbP domain-containing protein n=1 Tax=Soboliphyme baturini TaxID=241478 RepID=A0A183IWU9_9BILA|nr:unnamed protein product [Soboliphyme baturini]
MTNNRFETCTFRHRAEGVSATEHTSSERNGQINLLVFASVAPEMDLTSPDVVRRSANTTVASFAGVITATVYQYKINGEAVEQMEKFKYLEVVFTSDGKFEEKIDRPIGAASGVLRELARPFVTKAELSLNIKLSLLKLIFILMVT